MLRVIKIIVIISTFVCCKKKIVMKFDSTINAPRAEKIPYQLKTHGDIRLDNYYWIKEKENPEVIDYLERENDYYQRMTKSSKSLKGDLFIEMKKRIKEEDESVPYFLNGFWYITRYEKGKQYPIYTRKKDSLTANEEILFDCNKLAKGHDYFQLVGVNVSPDNTKVIYGIDLESRRKYTLYVKDLQTNEVLKTNIKNTTGSTAWSSNNNNFFYVKKNEQTLRPEKVFLHDISKPENLDTLIYNEKDETFSVYINESKSKEYIFLSSYSTLTSEYQFIKSSEPFSDFKLIQKRTRNLEYSVSHFKDKFYIMNNKDGAYNYKISETSIDDPSSENWIDILEHRDQVLLEDFEIFSDHWVVTERENGLTRIKVKRWDETEDYFIPVSGETYSLSGGLNLNFETSNFRFVYTSLSTPTTIFEYDMNSKTKKMLKQRSVPNSNFKSANYIEKRLWANSRDGEKIPISLVYHKDTELDSNTPLLLYAYGSYGYTIDPYFSSNRLSLLNRGFIYAIVHVRGGQYLGRAWYEKGKLLNKKNTFNDFIDSTKFLINSGISSADHMHAMGGSAGGLLMGVILNEAPFLYKSVIASVPFVDVITTMLDESIPLTTGEYDEWGNPNNEKYYNYLKSYSPYDNIKKQDYPNIMVTSGYHDSQVQYWEPTKWVAKLRDHKTDSNVLFLMTNMEAGHSGSSGRFNSLKEVANEYAFVLQLEGKVD